LLWYVRWKLADSNELHGVVSCALHQAMDLCSFGSSPEVAIAAVAEFSVLGQFPHDGVECIVMQCPVQNDTFCWCWGGLVQACAAVWLPGDSRVIARGVALVAWQFGCMLLAMVLPGQLLPGALGISAVSG